MRYGKIGAFSAAVLAVGLVATIRAFAGPAMSSAWLAIELDQDKCVEKASAVVKRQSFNTRFEVLGNSSIYGERGDYTALVRCATDQKIAYFVVAGPKGDLSSKYMNAIRDDF